MTVKLLKKSVRPFLPYVVFFCTGFSFRKRKRKKKKKKIFRTFTRGGRKGE